MRHKKDKPAKAKRGGKTAAAASPGADTKRKRKGGADTSPEPAPAVAPAVRGNPASKSKPGDGFPARGIEPPPLSTTATSSTVKGPVDKAPGAPASPSPGPIVTNDRRRWPERQGALAHGEGKRSGSDSRNEAGDSGDAPPRANKLVPTNAVHPTERRIKRRLHKNGAFMAAAAAALLGVLILTNQSEPPELVLNERQIASRLPTGQDWQSDAEPGTGSETVSEVATRGPETKISAGVSEKSPAKADTAEGKHVSAAPTTAVPPVRPLVSTKDLSVGEVFEMQRLLARLDLATGEPNGVIGDDTIDAIRTYQQIAGLPVDGEVSPDLLADMREVVRILDGNN